MSTKNLFPFVLLLAVIAFSSSCHTKEKSTLNNLRTYTTTVQLAYDNSQIDPACFIDLDSGKVYNVSNAAFHQKDIDLLYAIRYDMVEDPNFFSLGTFDGSSGYTSNYWDKTTLGINNFTYFNHTTFGDGNSSNTLSGFLNLKTITDLNTWLDGNTPIYDFEGITNTEIGNIYIFITQQNKRGAFRVINAENGSHGYITIEIKVEP